MKLNKSVSTEKISLPLLRRAGSRHDARAAAAKACQAPYAPQISSSDVTVAIESSSFSCFCNWLVCWPRGRVSSSEPITALEAIMEAGGFDYSRANLRKIHVIRHDKDTSQSYVLNLKDVLNGDDQNNFFLRPDDIVYVPEKFSWF